MAELILFAVKDPQGNLLPRTIAHCEYWARRHLVGAETHRWADAKVKGYAVVKVRVEEVSHG